MTYLEPVEGVVLCTGIVQERSHTMTGPWIVAGPGSGDL